MARPGGLGGFRGSRIKPLCPCTIVVKCMTIFSFSELLLHRIVRGTGEKLSHNGRRSVLKKSNKIKRILNLKKEYERERGRGASLL